MIVLMISVIMLFSTFGTIFRTFLVELKRDRIVDKGKPRIKAKNIEKEDKKELRAQTPQQPTPQEKTPQEQTAPEQNLREEELRPEKEEQEDPEDKVCIAKIKNSSNIFLYLPSSF